MRPHTDISLTLMTLYENNDVIQLHMPSVAQFDARPTGDQEVAGSTPAG